MLEHYLCCLNNRLIIIFLYYFTTAPPNFISEIFFITLAMHHYGPLQCYDHYNNLNKDLVELQKQYDRLKADQQNLAGVNIKFIIYYYNIIKFLF